MKESDYQGYVIDTFKKHGWKCWHVPTPMRPVGGNRFVPDSRGRGLLDLLLVRENPPGLVFAECKNETGRLSIEQTELLRLLRLVAQTVRERFPGEPCPVGAYVFAPGTEALVEAIAKGGPS